MKLKEGEDFYFNEAGLMVFTAEYHLKRGSCCKSGCTHCPWQYRKNQNQNKQTQEKPIN
jgi:hypothetical protein